MDIFEDVVRERVSYERGHLVVPSGIGARGIGARPSGLGVEVDEAKLQELRQELKSV